MDVINSLAFHTRGVTDSPTLKVMRWLNSSFSETDLDATIHPEPRSHKTDVSTHHATVTDSSVFDDILCATFRQFRIGHTDSGCTEDESEYSQSLPDTSESFDDDESEELDVTMSRLNHSLSDIDK